MELSQNYISVHCRITEWSETCRDGPLGFCAAWFQSANKSLEHNSPVKCDPSLRELAHPISITVSLCLRAEVRVWCLPLAWTAVFSHFSPLQHYTPPPTAVLLQHHPPYPVNALVQTASIPLSPLHSDKLICNAAHTAGCSMPLFCLASVQNEPVPAWIWINAEFA